MPEYKKTGSTAIQSYLATHRDGLAKIGIHYPDFGYKDHWPLGLALSGEEADTYLQRRANKKEGKKRTRRQTVRAVKRLVRDADPDSWILLSHETLSGSPQAKNLRALLTVDGQPLATDIIAYVRYPVAFYPSALQQKLNTGSITPRLPSEWRRSHLQRTERLREIFGGLHPNYAAANCPSRRRR